MISLLVLENEFSSNKKVSGLCVDGFLKKWNVD